MCFLFSYLLMAIFPFYRIDFPINEIPTTFNEIYYKDGYPHNINLSSDIEQRHKEIVFFFTEESKGWSYDINSYAPQYLLTSHKMTINCFSDNFIVVNYTDINGKNLQLSKQAKFTFPRKITVEDRK